MESNAIFSLKRIVLPVLLVTCVLSSHAQVTQVARYEKEHKRSGEPYTVISLKEKGIALFRDKDKYNDGQKLFELIILDSLLNESAYSEIGLSTRMRLIGYDYGGDYLYVLFRQGDSELGELMLMEYTLSTREITKFEIKHEFNLKLTHFSVIERRALLGGYVSRQPAALMFDMTIKKLKVLPGFFVNDTELLDLRVNENNTFNTLITNRANKSKKKLVLRTFDKDGSQLMEDEIEIDQDKTILTGLTSSLVRDELLIAGSYTIGNNKMATGFFSVLADPFKEQAIQYYDFGQLQHFTDYMSPKRAEKVKTTAKKLRDRGRDPEFRCSVSNVRLEERRNGFFLLAEAYNVSTSNPSGAYPYSAGYGGYYPYGANPYSSFSNRYYNSPYSFYNNQPLLTDYRMLSSSVVAFDENGKLEWDHSLKLKQERSGSLEQDSDFWCDNEKIVIAYKNESDLIAKLRYKNGEAASDTVKVLLKSANDLVRDEEEQEEGVRHWYSNKFYMWGYQTLKDPTINTEDRIRSVFYIVRVDAY